MEPLDPLAERILKEALGNNTNATVVKLDGQGPLWGMLAVGVALGATLLGVGWINATLQRQEIKIQQAEAYQKAVYMLAPRFAEEIDKELDRQKESK